jgi:hypothetical protein
MDVAPMPEPYVNPYDAGRNKDKIPAAARLQILDVHSDNPILAYYGQVYSCKWADAIGTSMFFAKSGAAKPTHITATNSGFDSLGTTRIKLVGQKVKLTKKPSDDDSQAENDEPNAKSSQETAGVSTPQPQTREEKQTAFLEKMKAIQQRRSNSFALQANVPASAMGLDPAP